MRLDLSKHSFVKEKKYTKKNEEYQALSKEINTSKSDIEKLEDQELELMESYDLKLDAIKEAEKTAKEAQNRADEQVGELKVREANQKRDKQNFEEERTQLASKIDPSVLVRYDRLLKKKKSKGLKINHFKLDRMETRMSRRRNYTLLKNCSKNDMCGISGANILLNGKTMEMNITVGNQRQVCLEKLSIDLKKNFKMNEGQCEII